jgi:hypothetical protein
VWLVPQSGHPLFMGARGPRDDGFRCGYWINLDLSIGVVSLMESTGAADDDLSWWSAIFEKFKIEARERKKVLMQELAHYGFDWQAAEQQVGQL